MRYVNTLLSNINMETTMIVCDTHEQIQMFSLIALKSALKLENMGMSRRGMSAAAGARHILGVKTRDKKKLLEQLEVYIEKMKAN